MKPRTLMPSSNPADEVLSLIKPLLALGEGEKRKHRLTVITLWILYTHVFRQFPKEFNPWNVPPASMSRVKYEILLQRFRVLLTESMAFGENLTNAKIEGCARGKAHEERMHNMEKVLSLTSEEFWDARGL